MYSNKQLRTETEIEKSEIVLNIHCINLQEMSYRVDKYRNITELTGVRSLD
jgi:hypothetical protein